MLGGLKAILGGLGAVLVQSWVVLEGLGAVLGSSWVGLGPTLGDLGLWKLSDIERHGGEAACARSFCGPLFVDSL